MELNEFFLERQNGKLTKEQEILTDELRVIIDTKSESTLEQLVLHGLIKEDVGDLFLVIGFEVATFYISWVEMVALTELSLPEERVRALKITLLTVRMTFCLKMKNLELLGGKSVEYWMDRMVGKCRRYWAHMRLNDAGSRAETCNILLEELERIRGESVALQDAVRLGIQENIMSLERKVETHLVRHGLKRMTFS